MLCTTSYLLSAGAQPILHVACHSGRAPFAHPDERGGKRLEDHHGLLFLVQAVGNQLFLWLHQKDGAERWLSSSAVFPDRCREVTVEKLCSSKLAVKSMF